jgi:broad specificity phosphatase PhoE
MGLSGTGSMPVIYLVRHGQTVANVNRHLQGSRQDTPLTDVGTMQARHVADMLKHLTFGAERPRVASSPLGRAVATTAIILETFGLPLGDYETDDRLREVDYGDWTGLNKAQVRESYRQQAEARDADPWNIPPPNGESYSQVAERALDWLRAQDRPVIAVSHGGFGRILRGVILGLDGIAIRALPEPHDCVFRLTAETVECIAD